MLLNLIMVTIFIILATLMVWASTYFSIVVKEKVQEGLEAEWNYWTREEPIESEVIDDE